MPLGAEAARAVRKLKGRALEKSAWLALALKEPRSREAERLVVREAFVRQKKYASYDRAAKRADAVIKFLANLLGDD